MVLLLSSLTIFLLYLIYERLQINRQLKSIPLRISVTGTRGKSSVSRLLASVLREQGRKVLAKTTGSEARFILPNGEETDVPRRGLPSIIEQKKLIRKAAGVNADCIVAEVMSIHPENHYVESQQILKPNIVVITNVRRDHTDAMGNTEEEIASVLSLGISAKARVFVPENEFRQQFMTAATSAGGTLAKVPEGISASLQDKAPELTRVEFSENIDLVYALGKHLNIDQQTIAEGIHKAKHDLGKFNIWTYQAKESQNINYFVNCFAVNDPDSTLRVVEKIRAILPCATDRLTGILSLRADRGDRTKQWIEALQSGLFDCFERIYVVGTHARIVERKLRGMKALQNKSPEKIMETILSEIENEAVVCGLGNLGGTGRILVDYWNEIGEPYGV